MNLIATRLKKMSYRTYDEVEKEQQQTDEHFQQFQDAMQNGTGYNPNNAPQVPNSPNYISTMPGEAPIVKNVNDERQKLRDLKNQQPEEQIPEDIQKDIDQEFGDSEEEKVSAKLTFKDRLKLAVK